MDTEPREKKNPPSGDEFFRRVVESVHDYAIFATDPEGRVISWNSGAERIFGYTGAEIIGRSSFVTFTPEDRERGAPEWELRTAAEKGRAEDERWHVRQDGTRFWASGIMTPLLDDEGRLRGFVKVASDYTERRLADEARLRLATIVESSDDAIISKNLEGRITSWNRGAARIFGYTEAEAVGQPVMIIIPQELRGEEEEILGRLRAGERVKHFETVRVAKGGRRVDVSLTISPIRDVEGRIVGASKIARDITEHKRAEESLRESEQQFRTLADSIPQLAWMADAKGYIFWYNQRWYEYTGTTFEEMRGWGWQKVHHPEEVGHVTERFRSAIASGEPWEDTFPLRGKEGEYRRFLSRALPIRDSEGRIVRWFGTNTDVEEQLRAAEEHERLLERERAARAEAEEANRTKDEFLATLSHELRTPLTAILGWSSMLTNTHLDEENTRQALESIQRNARAQVRLIDDILDVSRIITGKLRLDVRPVELAQVVGEAVESVRPAAEARGVRIQRVLDTGPLVVSGDADRLRQVVWNLLSNAVKFTPRGGRVQVRLERVDSHAEVVVSDTGRGIDAEVLPHVFERFRQADSSSTREHGGLGLGLAIVRHLVEMHGGTVRAESGGEGRGATFTVDLPLMIMRPSVAKPLPESERVHPTVETGEPLHCPPELEGLHVLFVDDDEDARRLLTAVLESCGARVTTVASAREALEKLEGEVFNVLLSDIGMPGEDGYWLIKRVRKLPPERGGQIPAAALTAYARTRDRLRVLRAGYQMHVPKPAEPAEVVAVVANLAGRHGDD